MTKTRLLPLVVSLLATFTLLPGCGEEGEVIDFDLPIQQSGMAMSTSGNGPRGLTESAVRGARGVRVLAQFLHRDRHAAPRAAEDDREGARAELRRARHLGRVDERRLRRPAAASRPRSARRCG